MEYFGYRAPTLWLSELIYVLSPTMIYCLNPWCNNPENPEDESLCLECGAALILKDRYRVVKKLGEGGFARVFEVVDNNGNKKVLKCLTKLEHLDSFKQEGRVLKQLWRPDISIPRVEAGEDYFTHPIEDCPPREIHCLLMEKIEGINLDKWMEDRQNKPIEEKPAIDWLLQLIKILRYLHHDKKYLHLDISPSNIMLKPDDGKLVLVDFGEVRQITNTYYARLGAGDEVARRVISMYAAPEQGKQGLGYPQSDFFALGLTFVHLLTGKKPCDFPKNERTKKPIWRNSAKQISKGLADLLDWMIEESIDKRPANVEIIKNRLENWRSLVNRPVWLREDCWQFVLPTSAIATTLIMGVRLTGILQSWELAVFDGMMRSRPSETIDRRILVVEVTQEDLGGKYPVEDTTLAKLIEKIEQHQPRVIGLDMHRYQARPPGRKEFIEQFQQNSNLLTVCAALDSTPNFYPPAEFSQKQLKEQVGYSDLIKDDWIDNSIRRQFLSYNPKFRKSPTCITPYSLSLVLAKRFLQAEGKPLTTLPNGDWHHDQVILKPLNARTGGYQNLSGESNEILINYRSNPKPANKVTLTQVLAGINPELVKDRIVLIGYTAKVARDNFNTPLGEMAGVWVHAQMTSQIISAVMDKRPLLWTLPQWGDAIFVWIWSLAGGAFASSVRSRRGLVVPSASVAAIALYLICYGSLVIGGWIPLVPSVLSLFTSGGAVFYIASKN
jgi:CHASE2 domain-containing sensor protein